MLRKIILLAASVAMMSTSAQAAFLFDITGTVSVNRGGGILTADRPMELRPGDRVLVRDGSIARVVYGADCVVLIKANQTFVVPSRATCDTGAMGAPERTASLSRKDGPVTTGSTSGGSMELGTTEVVLGGLVLGGVGAAVALSGGGPASP